MSGNLRVNKMSDLSNENSTEYFDTESDISEGLVNKCKSFKSY